MEEFQLLQMLKIRQLLERMASGRSRSASESRPLSHPR